MTDIWWMEILSLISDYRGILYAAARFPAVEIDEYPCIAEQLWAESQGLA